MNIFFAQVCAKGLGEIFIKAKVSPDYAKVAGNGKEEVDKKMIPVLIVISYILPLYDCWLLPGQRLSRCGQKRRTTRGGNQIPLYYTNKQSEKIFKKNAPAAKAAVLLLMKALYKGNKCCRYFCKGGCKEIWIS